MSLDLKWYREGAYAVLKCRKCDAVLTRGAGTWDVSERRAAAAMETGHACGMRPITTEEAREKMKSYRAEHPGLSFEEECRVYNEIMKNQTFI